MPTAFVLINTESASMPAVLKEVRAVEGVGKKPKWCMESMILLQK